VEWYQGFWPLREFGELPFPRLLSALEAAVSSGLTEHDEVKAAFAAARIPKEKHP
jgi:hypothetical protein